jgi:hypothetical protein
MSLQNASPNAPILNKILDKIDSMDKRMDKIEKRMDKIEKRIDALETSAQKTSPNTIILNKILDRIDAMDKRMDNIELAFVNLNTNLAIKFKEISGNFDKINEDMKAMNLRIAGIDTNLNLYIQNESEKQELIATINIQNKLKEISITAQIDIFPLKYFYEPNNNDMLTDLDGCITYKLTQKSLQHQNGHVKNIIEDKVFIIETKHNFTKMLFDKKIEQFCKILDTFKIIKNKSKMKNIQNSIKNNKVNTNFLNMVDTYNLQNFPDNIYFIFSSDVLTYEQKEFLSALNIGKLNEEIYNKYLIEYIKTHKIMNDIRNDDKLKNNIKNKLLNFQSLNELIDMFIINNNITGPEKEEKYSIIKYKDTFKNLILPYNNVKDCYNMLKGKIGYIDKDLLILPLDSKLYYTPVEKTIQI